MSTLHYFLESAPMCISNILPPFFAESTLSEQGELKPLSTSPEQQESASSSGSNSSQLQPLMSILGGVTTALILVTVVIIVTMRLRCGGRREVPSHDHTWKTDSGGDNSSVDLQAVDNHMGVLLRNRSPGKYSFYIPNLYLDFRYFLILYIQWS